MFEVNKKDTRNDTNETYFIPCSNVSIVNFEPVNAGWVGIKASNNLRITNFPVTTGNSNHHSDTLLFQINMSYEHLSSLRLLKYKTTVSLEVSIIWWTIYGFTLVP